MPLNPIEKSLAAGLLARISVPSTAGMARTFHAHLQGFDFPYIEAEFPGKKRPDDFSAEDWVITVNAGVHLVSIHARVAARLQPNLFRLQILHSRQHVQGRHYPRVEAEVYLRCFADGMDFKEWDKPLRKKADISQTGIRFLSEFGFSLGAHVRVELYLPGQVLEKAVFEGEVLRTAVKESGRYEITLRITAIDPGEEEKMAAFCMVQQFRNMTAKAEGFSSLKGISG
jgi:hypothetical protein